MKAAAIEILGGLLVMLAIAVASYGYGAHVTDNAWRAKQAAAERQQAAKYQAEVARADDAAAAYLQEHRDQEDRYETLDDQFKALRKRLPLTLPAVPAHVAVASAADAAASPAPAPADGAEAGERLELRRSDSALPRLSLGAVWMWNSALAGRDVAARACDAAAAAAGAEAACAQDSGLDVEDAWANQQDNARSCARDRQRYRSLIEYLKGRTQ